MKLEIDSVLYPSIYNRSVHYATYIMFHFLYLRNRLYILWEKSFHSEIGKCFIRKWYQRKPLNYLLFVFVCIKMGKTHFVWYLCRDMRVIVCFFIYICNKDTAAVGWVYCLLKKINYNIPLLYSDYLKLEVEIIKFSSVKSEFMTIEIIIYCIHSHESGNYIVQVICFVMTLGCIQLIFLDERL